ncbi:hypothetical protein ACEUAM_01460 [Aeromonas hydrophila]|uniref:hypothetical protein n=1 Tax=Aeromonas hydrophila TaxID=644 RepID=UPI0038D2385A
MMQDDSVVEWRKICEYCHLPFVDSMSKPFYIRVRDFKVAHGVCKACREKKQKEMEKIREAASLYWTFDSVKEFFETNPPYKGQELIVYDTSWNENTYAIVTVVEPSHGRQKRIVVESYSNGYSGQSFYRSGKNCFAPKGQVRLLPYHEVIGGLIKASSSGILKVSREKVFEIIEKK